MKHGKRLLSCLLALAVSLTMLVMPAYADDAAEPESSSESDTLALLPLFDLVEPEFIELSPEAAAELEPFQFISTNNKTTSSCASSYSAGYLYSTLNDDEKSFFDAMNEACQKVINSDYDYIQTVDFGSSKPVMVANITFSNNISLSRAKDLTKAFRYCNPQYYFLSNSYGWYSTSMILLFSDAYNHPFAKYTERKAAQDAIDAIADDWMPKIYAKATALDKEICVADLVCDYLEYDYPAANGDDDLLNFDQTLASGVLRKTTVCAGYSQLTAYFCNRAGINCFTVSSPSHAWNLVKLYDNWYQLDTTFADTGASKKWYNLSYDTIRSIDTQKAHTYDTLWSAFTLPECKYDTVQVPSGEEPVTILDIKVTPPTKTAYFTGETLDLAGGIITVYYSNGTKKDVELSAGKVTGYDNKNIGKQTITVTYENFTDTFEVSVKEPEVTGIKVTPPAKTTYFVGEELDLTGGKITVSYDYGSPVEAELKAAKIEGYDKTKAGTQTLTVTYLGFTDKFDVTVKKPAAVTLTLTAPKKTTYYVGEELDLTGGKITVKYEYGSPATLDLTSEMIEGYDKNTAGTQTVTVKYEGLKATFDVTVKNAVVIAIKVNPPTKTAYYAGDELDLTGGSITVTYDHGDASTIALTAEMVSGYNKDTAGKQTLTVTYSGKTATFVVNVTALKLNTLTISKMPKTSYFLGDALDLTGGELTAEYNSGKTETVAMTDSRVKATGFDSSRTGNKTVTLTYSGKTVKFTATVSVDPSNAPVIINGKGYETLTAALKDNTTGDLDITININTTEKNISFAKTIKSIKLTTAPGKTLTLTAPVINANCDLTIDASIAPAKSNARTLTVKAAADKKVTIKRLDTALPLTLSGTKTSSFVLDTGSTVKLLSGAAANFEIAAGTTVKLDGGKFTPTNLSGAGKLDVYNAATLNIANAVSADVTLNKYVRVIGKNTLVNLQKFMLGTVTKLNLTVKEANGALSNITGQTVITLVKQDTVPDLETKITITNTANGKPLSAVQYKKEVRAEYLDALTLVGVKNFSSFDKAFEAMTDPAGSYTLRLNEDMTLSKVTFPKAVGSLTIDGNGRILTLNGVTTLSPKFGFSLRNINIKSFTRTGAAGALTLNLSSGASAIDGLAFTGTALNIKGGKDSTLTLGVCSQIASLGGFADTALTGVTTIEKILTANNITLGSAADLRLLSGAQFTVNRGMVLSAESGAKITLTKGFKPIVINGSVSGAKIKLVSSVTLEDQPIFRTKSDLTGLFDISAISPSNGLSYDLLTSNGVVYLKAFTIELNGVKYAFWDDVIKAMNSKTTNYTISLLADITIDGALKLPTAAKCGSLTINGNGHKLVFTGNSVSLTVPTTLKNITISAYNKRTGVGAAWKLVTNKKLTKAGTVNLVNCTEK
ncbi:MAG: bacterial Ig-like domain-containing protein [Ruminiclostridium sp.]|nr:bacterial Ig-like domain-containing protein [Ruminiclostridium sp.]